jgi:hypothetical protein
MGCSGGGGSGGGGGNGGLNYSGKTAAAAISENNAVNIAAGAFAAGQMGTVMTISEASQDDPGMTPLRIDHFPTLNLPRILGDAARSVDLSPQLHQLSLKAEAIYTESGTEYGPCGGSFSYTVEIDDVSGEFEGTFVFSNYCDLGVTINGDTDVEGQADLNSGDIITIAFRFSNLSDGAMAMDGKVSIDFSDVPVICLLNAYLKDEATGKVYWARDYSLNIYEYPGRVEVEIFGRFYHPDHGYVELTTEEVFVIYDGDGWPSSGILLMVGANGTRAKLTAVDEATCIVDADTDGDGFYDWSSGPLLWIELVDEGSPSGPPGPPGEIQNPGFEEGSTGWFMARTPGTDCTFTIAADAYEGAQAAKLTVANDGYCMLANSATIPIDQTATYHFNSYAKVSGDVNYLTIAIWKSDNPSLEPTTFVGSIQPNTFSGDYEFNQLTVDLAAGDYIRLELGIDNNASGSSSVLFDNLELINE